MTRPTLQQLTARLAGLSWSRTAIAALAAAVAVALGALLAFAVAVEDVTNHNGLATSDGRHLHWFTAHRTGPLVDGAKALTTLGSVGSLVVLTVVVGALLWRHGVKLALAATPLLALGTAGVLVAIVKAAVGRARPPVSLHLVTEADASFPSGHATDSTAALIAIALVLVLTVVQRRRLRVLVVAAAGGLSAAIGWSRLELGVHWPSDVLAGGALGLFVALTVTTVAVAATRLTPPERPARATGERLRAAVVRTSNARRPHLPRAA